MFVIKIMCLCLSALSAGAFEPKEVEQGINPVHQLYLELKAQGLSPSEISDQIAASHLVQTEIRAYPLEDCYKKASDSFAQNVKTCNSLPQASKKDCFQQATEMHQQQSNGCTYVYGLGALRGNNPGNSSFPNPATKK